MPATRPDNYAQMDQDFLWHPFTPMRQWIAGEPIVVESGEGFELIDTRGRRYIDGSSSLWCNLHGHRAGAIDDAVRAQLGKIAHSTLLGLASIPSIELAARLVGAAPPGLKKVFFSDSGAGAVEAALKIAYQYYRNLGQDRRFFLALREGYHGDTIGAVSVGGIDAFHRLYRPLLFETVLVDSPNPYRHPAAERSAQAVLQQIDAALAARPKQCCAVILEPLIQAAAGMLTHPAGFLASLRELTRRHDVLLIVDEVATGFCRTGGKLFACQHENVSPDLMCLGKGLTGGYLPVAATLATQRIFDAFCGDLGEGKTFYHGHTFTGNALGLAAAVASFDLIYQSGLLEKLPAKAEYIRRRLAELADHPHVGDIRQCGMMAGIELVRNRRTKEPFEPGAGVGTAACNAAVKRGLMIRPLDDVIVLMPAPGMDESTLARMMDAVVTTIHEYFAQNSPV